MIRPLNQRPNFQANALNKNSDAKVETQSKEVRTNESAKLKEITDSIANGTYQVDISKTARAVADVLL